MENLQDRLYSSGRSLNNDTSSEIRMSQPPSNAMSQALASGFSKPGNKPNRGEKSSYSSKPGASRTNHSNASGSEQRRILMNDACGTDSDSDSSDPLDVLPRDSKKSQSTRATKTPSTHSKQEVSPKHEELKYWTRENLKRNGLNFKKNKKGPQDTPEPIGSPSIDLTGGDDLIEIDGVVHTYHRPTDALVPTTMKRRPSTSTQSTYKAPGAPAKTPQNIPASLRRQFVSPVKPDPAQAEPSAPLPSRPLPRRPPRSRPENTVNSGKSSDLVSSEKPVTRQSSRILSEIVNDNKEDNKKSKPASSRARSRPAYSDIDSDESIQDEPKATKPAPLAIRDFPMQLPLVSADDLSTPRASKIDKGKRPIRPVTCSSPTSSYSGKALSQTSLASASESIALSPPASSPVSSRENSSKKKSRTSGAKINKNRVVSSSDDHASCSEDGGRIKPRPFPMETQVLESLIDSPLKRMSEDDDFGVFRSKRPKRQSPKLPRHLADSDEEDDLDFLNRGVDHSTLCPWCDELLPPVPSPHLQKLIDDARKRSFRDSRPSNTYGLRAQLTVFSTVCQRHTFERVHVPLAEKNGWPMKIKWDELSDRVTALKEVLKRIVDDVDEEWLPGHVMTEEEKKAVVKVEEDPYMQQQYPRKGSTFWKEVIKNVKTHGSKQAVGVRNQFSNFAKTQPGYYGELGYVIIHQTIYDLFPPASFPIDSTLPLSPTEFIQLILVPEAAVSLIREDLMQERAPALKTLRASTEYGVAMFPDEDNEAGERIVEQRARTRRKELEAAGELVLDEGDAQSSKKKRGKASKKVTQTDDSDVVMVTDPPRTNVPRPKPRQKRREPGGTATSSKPNSKASETTEVLDLCYSTDSMKVSTSQQAPSSSSQPKPRPRPRPPARRPKDNHSHTDASDLTEGEPIFKVPTSETIVLDSDIEETPRPNKIGRVPSGMVSSMFSVPDAAPLQKSKAPGVSVLELARQKRHQFSQETKNVDVGWAQTSRDLASETDDDMKSDTSRASRASRRARSKRSSDEIL